MLEKVKDTEVSFYRLKSQLRQCQTESFFFAVRVGIPSEQADYDGSAQNCIHQWGHFVPLRSRLPVKNLVDVVSASVFTVSVDVPSHEAKHSSDAENRIQKRGHVDLLRKQGRYQGYSSLRWVLIYQPSKQHTAVPPRTAYMRGVISYS